MYLEHFKLKEAPFTLTPNLSKYYDLSQQKKAIQMLCYGLSQGECLMKVVGEVGLGKTLLCRRVLKQLDEEYVTCYIFNPFLSGNDLLKAICEDLGLSLPNAASRFAIIKTLSDHLLTQHEEDKQVVLLIDEAHLLTNEAIEVLRLLTNLETESKKLLQIILVGQPELDGRLAQPGLRQIQQRIAYSANLSPLSEDQVDPYIRSRLATSGYAGGRLFSEGAIRVLNQYSGGVPRVINILCNKAMLIAFSKNALVISEEDMKEAVADSKALTQTVLNKKRKRIYWVSAALTSIGLCIAGLLLWLGERSS